MVEALCSSGNHERLKGSVHGAASVLAILMAAYNITACWFRRDTHLRVNAVVYTLAIAWEVKQTMHHLQRAAAAPAAAAVIVSGLVESPANGEPTVSSIAQGCGS
jgi:hypothetical protein